MLYSIQQMDQCDCVLHIIPDKKSFQLQKIDLGMHMLFENTPNQVYFKSPIVEHTLQNLFLYVATWQFIIYCTYFTERTLVLSICNANGLYHSDLNSKTNLGINSHIFCCRFRWYLDLLLKEKHQLLKRLMQKSFTSMCT